MHVTLEILNRSLEYKTCKTHILCGKVTPLQASCGTDVDASRIDKDSNSEETVLHNVATAHGNSTSKIEHTVGYELRRAKKVESNHATGLQADCHSCLVQKRPLFVLLSQDKPCAVDHSCGES